MTPESRKAMEKKKGLYQKYEVTKLSNPEKKMDCVVLEFDDPIARIGIKAWAQAMWDFGYRECASEVLEKIRGIEEPPSQESPEMRELRNLANLFRVSLENDEIQMECSKDEECSHCHIQAVLLNLAAYDAKKGKR